MRAAVEPLRVPGAERAELVDNPPVVACRRGMRRRVAHSVAETLWLADALVEQQLDVIEKELTALRRTDGAHWTTCREVGRLRQNPRIAQHTPANKHALDAEAH